MEDYEKKYHERKLHSLKKTALSMGFNLVAQAQVASPVS